MTWMGGGGFKNVKSFVKSVIGKENPHGQGFIWIQILMKLEIHVHIRSQQNKRLGSQIDYRRRVKISH